MKKLILLSLMFSGISYAQRLQSFENINLNKQLISPTIVQDLEQTTIFGNADAVSIYVNKPIETQYDKFTLGGGFNYNKANQYYNGEVYIGGSNLFTKDGKWHYNLNAGYYTLDTYGLGKTRSAFYFGASMSWHYTEDNYFGVSVKDVSDVCTTDVGYKQHWNPYLNQMVNSTSWSQKDDDVFYTYEAMTPTFFGNYLLYKSYNDDKISLYGDYSYSDVQKSVFNVSLTYSNENLSTGVFYSDKFTGYGAFARYDWERIGIYASQSTVTSLGLILH